MEIIITVPEPGAGGSPYLEKTHHKKGLVEWLKW
jgi:hypothetical protein